MGFQSENRISIRAVGHAGRICAPEQRLRIARRFQRRVKWNTERVLEGRLKVLTHALKAPKSARLYAALEGPLFHVSADSLYAPIAPAGSITHR